MKFHPSIKDLIGKDFNKDQLLELGVMDPIKVVEDLDKYIIGQDNAKRSIALMLLNRSILMLKASNVLRSDLKIVKSNVLLLGPTGSGKTALIKAVTETTGIPIFIYDITSTTGAGYYGIDLIDMLNEHIDYQFNHYKNFFESEGLPTEDYYTSIFDFYNKIIEFGILYIDEIDKLRIPKEISRKDGWGSMLQVELLKMIEGHEVNLVFDKSRQTGKTVNQVQMPKLDTTNMFFVAGGAFSGLDEIIKTRLKLTNNIGFLSNQVQKTELSRDAMQFLKTEDLIEYGFMPEFIGRFPIKSILKAHTVETMKKIMLESHNSVYLEYKDMFTVFGVKLKFTNSALNEVAKIALKLNVGARALKSIFNEILEDKLFSIFHNDNNELVIDKQDVIKKVKI
jgi:ATP-dependent Clp protease ATP-binding subunit ClpX